MGLGLSFGAAKARASPTRCATSGGGRAGRADMDRLRYVFEAVSSIRRAAGRRVRLIGFSAAVDAGLLHWSKDGLRRLPAVKTCSTAGPDLMHRIWTSMRRP